MLPSATVPVASSPDDEGWTEPRKAGVAVPAIQVAVCGPRECGEADAANARAVGRLLAEAGATVLCGGGGGVMAAVAEGASEAGGLVIGVRPDTDRDSVCAGLSAVLYTNMGEARNAILVWSADAVIVIGGSWGTLSELALANRRGGVRVVMLGGWQILDADGELVDAGIAATSPESAVAAALGRM
ncbi:LOG family protein [Nocardia cyriacigeorgica]|nr:LOG family protein [Nocardia cyriacigeorgica]MBF6399175.1 LOG family protein [Nocardia cyriacigeorgica]MBF6404806.1 LOG family protein [Nocardia cyriacigeorgica]MBF6514618.1 LOG family protein [Nocardia cyriacigeorgica]MBF6535424.1 LOG family protein [Nocardia cyriacigeorgica]